MLTNLLRRFLLDTNIIIALFAQEGGILHQLSQANEVFLSSIALGELYYGAQKSSHAAANCQRIDDFASQNVVLVCDTETGQQYGKIKEALHVKGRPIPENDIWIAALALQHNLILVTRDAHFNEISGLTVATW